MSISELTFVVKTSSAYLHKMTLTGPSKVKIELSSNRPINMYIRRPNGDNVVEFVELRGMKREFALEAGKYTVMFSRKACLMPWKKAKVKTCVEVSAQLPKPSSVLPASSNTPQSVLTPQPIPAPLVPVEALPPAESVPSPKPVDMTSTQVVGLPVCNPNAEQSGQLVAMAPDGSVPLAFDTEAEAETTA